jgi:hypothetical protein
MSRILKRPMFKMGGSTSAGITSGLSRQGYHAGHSVQTGDSVQDVLTQYGRPPRGYNVYDFLTEWGLNMVGNPPSGNVIQTAGKEAQIPFGKMVEGKGQSELTDYMLKAKAIDTVREQKFREKMLTDEYGLKSKLTEEEYGFKEELENTKNLHKEQKSFMELKKAERINSIISTDLPAAIKELNAATLEEDKLAIQAKIDGLKTEQASLERENKMLQSVSDDEFNTQRNYVEDLMVLEMLKDLEKKYEAKEISEKEWRAHNSQSGKSKLKKKVNQQEVFNRTVTFILGLKKKAGGRVGYQGGELVEDVSVTETMGPRTNQQGPQGPQRLTFGELRARLPREISDSIIQLLATSDEALLQFANIRTQQDVDQFNQTYQVDLILPQAEA